MKVNTLSLAFDGLVASNSVCEKVNYLNSEIVFAAELQKSKYETYALEVVSLVLLIGLCIVGGGMVFFGSKSTKHLVF